MTALLALSLSVMASPSLSLPQGIEEFEKNLLPVGAKVPDLTLKTPEGKEVKFSEVFKKNKATLINFWFYNCVACRAELPHVQKIYADAKDKGLAVLALNRGDTPERVTEYWRSSGFTFYALMAPDEVHQKFGVRAYPTNYIVNNKGEVVARFVGFDEKKLLGALEKLGIKVSRA